MVELPQIPKLCSTCRKVNICKIYEAMVGTQQTWDNRFEQLIKFPIIPESIAKDCTEYESPYNVKMVSSESLV